MYPYETEHMDKMRAIAPECMVLLKANGDFPLEASCRIALYGSGARRTIKGGTGSGDVNSRFYTTVEQGLENAGFEITTKAWLDAYDIVREEAHRAFVAGIKDKAKAVGVPAIFLGMGAVMPEPEYDLPMDGVGDTAVYVLSRISGEGADRSPQKGDLKLTDTEVSDILKLQKNYKRFLLVLNVGGIVDLAPVERVDNILILSQLGAVTGDAMADVLLGRAYPSGKLSSTWTAWEDYPVVGEFGQEDDTRYVEGIYVGYRYFDSVGKKVLFPFGHGMGYTTFAMGEYAVKSEGTRVLASVRVTNTGKCSGKEVVQIYVSVPSGKLDQPYQVLAAFQKTRELAAGESQILELGFGMEQLSSFDKEKNCGILEAGNYIIRIGCSSRDRVACAIVNLDAEVVVQKLSGGGGEPDFADWKPETPAKVADYRDLPVLGLKAASFHAGERIQPHVSMEAMETVRKLSDSNLAYLCCGNYRTGEENRSVIGTAGTKVPGAAGEITDRLEGIPGIIMADGPAGLRLEQQYGVDEQGIYSMGGGIPEAFADFVDEAMLNLFGMEGANRDQTVERHGRICEQYCTAIPIGTALAQSWSEEVCEICGDVVGEEMERFGIHLWLAPAFNIHRNPLCGRNFEYCSEDPLISGRISAAITRGVQAHPGRGVTVKHFCCNNQETNRFRSNSVVSGRALRDIYLKGFEICIRESEPAAVMTSYNLLNGIHTSERKDLLDGILRGEWGFGGVVMTDWITKLSRERKKYPYASAVRSVAAGNDLIMPGGYSNHEEILAALTDGELKRRDVEVCAARVVELAWRLGGRK